MENLIINKIIKQEKKLLDKTDTLSILIELIDDEFIEIGSSATEYNKASVVEWLKSNDESKRTGSSFKARQISDDIILLTYISAIKDTPDSEKKYAARSSIWRLRDNKWRMVFHQGTPIK